MRCHPPPIDTLCEPFCMLSVFSMLPFVVFRGCGLLFAPGSVINGKSSTYPPWFSNMSLVMLPKKLFGDHCQPPLTSLTIVDDSVERMPNDPVVRYEVWKPSFL